MHQMQQSLRANELDELVVFSVVAETLSFTRASRVLGRDATVLSRRVTALEARVGVRLLERTTRKLSLTSAGTTFAVRIGAALSALQDAEAVVSNEARGSPRGRLRVALPSTFSRFWLAPYLPAFLARYPDIIFEGESSNRYVDLLEGGFDAAVRLGSLRDSSLVARKLAPQRRVICAAPRYLRAHGTPKTAHDLREHVCLGFSAAGTYPEWRLRHRRTGLKVSVRCDGRLVLDDSEALLTAAMAGTGVFMAADWLVARAVRQGRLVELLPEWPSAEDGGIFAVVPSNRLLAGKTRAFIDWLVELFERPPWLDDAKRRAD